MAVIYPTISGKDAEGPAKPLVDGLMVLGGTGLRTLSANWLLLVALDAPLPPTRLQNDLLTVSQTIAKVKENPGTISKATLCAWEDRVELLKIAVGTQPNRKKRGLFDLGGLILHGLFGVATNDQINKYKTILNDMRINVNTIMHVIPELVTVINQTRVYVQENRQQLDDLVTHQEEVEKYLKEVQKVILGYRQRIAALETHQELDRILTILELLTQEYVRQKDTYHVQRTSLEVGHLTEDLLPPSILQDILEQAVTKGFNVIPQLAWYYQYLSVEPIWSDQDNLLYKVEIPLIDSTDYLQYTIKTFPVPYEQSSVKATLEVEGDIGFNTNTGGLFFPANCKGHKPSICHSGPVYDSSKYQCPRGIITGVQSPTKYCTVTIEKLNNDTIINQVDINSYVVTTWGETIRERCAGKSEKLYSLKADTYMVNVGERCSIKGQGWTVSGIVEKNVKKHLTQKPINVTVSLNITRLNFDPLPSFKVPNPLNHLAIVKNVPIDKNVLDIPIKVRTYHQPVGVYVLTGVILLLIIACGMYLYYVHYYKPKYTGKQTIDQEIDMIPLKSLDIEPDDKTVNTGKSGDTDKDGGTYKFVFGKQTQSGGGL